MMQTIANSKFWRALLVTALFVSSIAFVAGSIGIWYSYDKNEKNEAADDKVKTCLVAFALDLSQTLRQRDQLATISREANIEWLDDLLSFVEGSQTYSQEALVKSIQQFRDSLVGLNSTAKLNKYPDLGKCFIKQGVLNDVLEGDQGAAVEALLLVSTELQNIPERDGASQTTHRKE